MKFRSMKKLITALVMATALLVAGTISASACTTIFVGGDLTTEGAPIVSRSEDYVNSMNKLFIINEAGKYKAGEKFVGCPAYGGFEWTWSHDSYRFTSFTADNVYNGVCPECGLGSPESPVTHDSYTESGANEMGVVVSATETLYGNGKCNAKDVDPMRTTKVDGKVGIEETDIPTVILAEAATAREGIELLCRIYDEYGCYYASGLFIADQEEIWYIENCSGTQYVALKLPSDILFLEPNMAVIGEIDLDDTENVIASDRLIEVAKQANSFVGNEEENIINFRASYSRITMDTRMVNGLNFINKDYNYTSAQLSADNSLFTISNVKDGEIVAPYTNIKADRPITVDDIVNYYKVPSIGHVRNVDTAFFQIFEDRPLETAIVKWTAMDHGAYNVFIPHYPALLDDLYEGYGVGTDVITYQDVKPNTDLTYGVSQRVNGQSVTRWVVYPEGWQDSFFWCYDVLSNYMEYTDNSQADYVKAQFKVLQEQFYEEFKALDVSNPETANANATALAKSMAERAHALALEMIEHCQDAHVPTDYHEFLGKLDYDQAMVNAQALVEGIGVRLTGTKAEIAGLDYIEEQYAKLGYTIERQDFTLEDRTSGDIYIGDMVLAAGTPSKPGLNDTVKYFTGFRPATGTSVYLANPAKASELGDMTGKIVFFPGNFRIASGTPVSQATYDAVKILQEKHAAGIVMMMDARTEETERYKIRVTTPNFKNVDMIVDTPLLVLNAMDAEKMMAYFAEHDNVPVNMDVRDHVDSQNLIVTKEASVPTDMTLYVTSHIDSVLPSPGANDNASGVVGILAMAEAFKDVDTNYDIKFITFGAEEVGLQGARYFANNLTKEEIANAIGNYNLDMVATSQEDCVYIFMNSSVNEELGYNTPVNDPSSETHVTRMSREAAIQMGFDLEYYRTCYDRTTDHYALHLVGIPAVEFDWRANAAGTSFEAYYHTRFDDFQHNFSREKLQTQVDIIALAVYNDATANYAAVTGEGVYRTYHDTLADAVASLEKGETVKLLRDNNETITFVDKMTSFTLDENGYDFTGSVEATGKLNYVVEFENGTYTITLNGSSTPVDPEEKPSTPVVPPVTPVTPVEPEKPVFTDVDANAWYNAAVKNALDKGLMAGTSATTFEPNAKLTRAMVVQILYSLEGKPAVTGTADFSDVAANDWFAAAVKWASDNNIVSGMGDGTFAPNANVTREQLAVILMAYAKSEGKNVTVGENTNILSYTDAEKISEWAIPAMQWAVGSGIISGKTADTLDPQGTATRAEVAQMIMKFETL